MSEFSAAMSLTWDTSSRVFGDTVTIGGVSYPCIIHGFEATDSVIGQRQGVPGRPGRSADVAGQVVMRSVDWAAAGGRKGTQVTFSFGTFRVLNNPDVGHGSAEVVLNIGPLNS